MSLLDAGAASLSSFAGAAIDQFAIMRAERQWGIFSSPGSSSKTLNSFASFLGDDVKSVFGKKPQRVLSAAHVDSLDIVERSSISSAPQEEGHFTSYNKVFEPFQSTIRFICDGSETGNLGLNLLPGFLNGALGNGPDKVKKSFSDTLAALVKDTHLYFVATPQRLYKNANIVSYRFSRKSTEGADIIVVDVTLQEVRTTVKTGWTTVKRPQGANKQNVGTVTPSKD